MSTNSVPQLPQLSDTQLHIARDIEICVGPYHQPEDRRAAMESLLSGVFSMLLVAHDSLGLFEAARVAGIDIGIKSAAS